MKPGGSKSITTSLPIGSGLRVLKCAHSVCVSDFPGSSRIPRTCAAVSAARLGLKVALVHDRPVLGGNNSSEVRVWLQGARNKEPWPRIGDVVAELEQPHQVADAHGLLHQGAEHPRRRHR